MPNAFDIFRVGTHTSSSGATISFTAEDLHASVDAYDTQLHEAPIVVGHPKQDAPAYGWIKTLALTGDRLRATPHQVDPGFSDLVKSGRFKKISASFYAPDSPQNPKPGVYYLRHVGFLGAQPPAVKGLRPGSFSEVEGVLEFDDASLAMAASDLWRRLREFLIAQHGLEAADTVVPAWLLEDLEAQSRANDNPGPDYADPRKDEVSMNEQEITAREAALEELEAQHDKRVKELEAREEAVRLQGVRQQQVAFVEKLVSEGRVLPADLEPLVEFMTGLPEGDMLEFADGDTAIKTSSEEWLKGFLGRLPKQVEFEELSGPGDNPVDTADAATISRAALEFQEKEDAAGRHVTMTQAVRHVMGGAK